MRIDFYYDIVCPYAYLASTQVEAVAARCGAEVHWQPVLLGGIFRSVGGHQVPMQHMNVAKAHLNILDLQRWADVWGCALNFPAEHPRRTVAAMRLLVATPPQKRPDLTTRLYKAYWQDGLDLADRAVLDPIARESGLDPHIIDSDTARDGLFATTAEAVRHGAFGVPAMVIDGRLFWGQDRLHFVENALGGTWPGLPPGPKPNRRQTIRFFHDFSSPFSYLAATQIERVANDNGADIDWRPILLGGLFRELGTPDVPLFEMPKPKREYMGRDLEDWAQWWRVPFRFPDNFPLRTVQALRVALVAPEITLPLYRAAWSENRAIDDPDVLKTILTENGLDADAVLEKTQSNVIKRQLRDNTELARAAGACGVPTFEIQETSDRSRFLVWGQDRIELLVHALRGWRPLNTEAGRPA